MSEKYVDLFIQILAPKLKNKRRKSSQIAVWLGQETSNRQSLSIIMGNVIEEYLNTIITDHTATKQILNLLDTENKDTYKLGKRYKIGKHQIDLLFMINDTIFHREIKSNTDLDNGKKRDTLNREKEINILLSNMFPDYKIDSGVFCPFNLNDRNVSGIGYVNGISWFCDTVGAPFSAHEFLSLGQNKKLQELLTSKGYN